MSQDFYEFVRSLWDQKPTILVLFVGGFAIFLLLVVNTFRHRRELKKRRPQSRHH